MRIFDILLFEWRHFVRSPFKWIALLMFIWAGVYGLHNGAELYNDQTSEINRIQESSNEKIKEAHSYFEQDMSGPEDRPWVDIGTPFWAIWYTPVYLFKPPSPLIVYGTGQAEQYGFYKRITFWSTPYDSDMVEEISNPERLLTGSLDFSFVILFLAPVLLIVWLHTVKGKESDSGLLPLIYAQTGSPGNWLVSRVAFYFLILVGVLLAMMGYGSMLTPVFDGYGNSFWTILAVLVLYLLVWSVLFVLIIHVGRSGIANTLTMVGAWILLALILPAMASQWVVIQQPANLMTAFIDSQRDERQELYNLPDSIFDAKMYALYPEIKNSPVANDSSLIRTTMSRTASALVNELSKTAIQSIEEENDTRNQLIEKTFWLSPVSYFQNQMNRLTKTHYSDYKLYRKDIQNAIDLQIRTLVSDTWNAVSVDKEKYIEYLLDLSGESVEEFEVREVEK